MLRRGQWLEEARMVEGLSRKITGDWVELSEASLSLNGIIAYFNFPKEALRAIANELKASGEEGVLEYKRKILLTTLNFLEDLKYSTPNWEELVSKKTEVGKILFVTLIQRLFAAGTFVFRAGEDQTVETSQATDLKTILADIMGRLRDNPQLKNNTSVKLILTQLAIYQRERETMQKLAPNISDMQKAKAFQKNFQETFKRLAQNIRKYYTDFLKEERKEQTRLTHLSLADFALRSLLTIYTKQAREFLRFCSTLEFAIKGKYKVREICVHLVKEKHAFLALLDQEKIAFSKLVAQAKIEKDIRGENVISFLFANEIAQVLLKVSERATEES